MKTILSLALLVLATAAHAEVKEAGTFVPHYCSSTKYQGIPMNPYQSVCWGSQVGDEKNVYFSLKRLYNSEKIYQVVHDKVLKGDVRPGGTMEHEYTLSSVGPAMELVKIRVSTQALPPPYSYIRTVELREGGLKTIANEFKRMSVTQ